MENFILNQVILFILFYFVIPMMLWLDTLLRFYVVIEPIIVGRWNSQFYSLFE